MSLVIRRFGNCSNRFCICQEIMTFLLYSFKISLYIFFISIFIPLIERFLAVHIFGIIFRDYNDHKSVKEQSGSTTSLNSLSSYDTNTK